MSYLRRTDRTESIALASLEYDRALRVLKRSAMKAGREATRENIEAAQESSEALAQALTNLRRAEHASGIKFALNHLTRIVEEEGGHRARSIAAFRIVDLMRQLFTESR